MLDMKNYFLFSLKEILYPDVFRRVSPGEVFDQKGSATVNT